MEEIIHFMVKLSMTNYILYKVWHILFKENLFGLWDKIPVRTKKKPAKQEVSVIKEKNTSDIMGKTHFRYLENPDMMSNTPVFSEKLEPSGFIGEEPDIKSEEVESDLSLVSLTPEEMQEEIDRFEPDELPSSGYDPDFSTGLTYEEMENAVSVLTVPTDNEEKIIQAAKTILDIKDTDLYEFMIHQVSNIDSVERLLDDCLDHTGSPLPERKSKKALQEFDITQFVYIINTDH